MVFVCNYCKSPPFPHFRALLEHYWAYHAEKKKLYGVKRKDHYGVALVYATNKDEAAYATGWDKKDCIIKEILL